MTTDAEVAVALEVTRDAFRAVTLALAGDEDAATNLIDAHPWPRALADAILLAVVLVATRAGCAVDQTAEQVWADCAVSFTARAEDLLR